MRVSQITTCDEGITNPQRSVWGITFALRWGNVLFPYGEGSWFTPPIFTKALNFYSYLPIPWITWNFWGWRGYLGAKVYGVDLPTYTSFTDSADVYEGSLAMMPGIRLKIGD